MALSKKGSFCHLIYIKRLILLIGPTYSLLWNDGDLTDASWGCYTHFTPPRKPQFVYRVNTQSPLVLQKGPDKHVPYPH